MDFYKYEAAGNDFVVIDGRGRDVLQCCRANAVRWCDRHFGIGADGVLCVADGEGCDAFMHIVNADGTTASMCGNGIRCVARYLLDAGASAGTFSIGTLGGVQTVRCLEGGLFEVRMARAELGPACEIAQDGAVWSGRRVDVGNPHAVFEVCESPADALRRAGAFLSNHPSFPDRSNVEFVRAVSERVLEFAVYERGVGPTLACGTGCVAAATAYAAAHGLAGAAIELRAPGGTLSVRTAATPRDSAFLVGSARRVFAGAICS